MKILQLTTFFYPVVGGVETQVADLSQQLSQAGYQVSILTTTATHNDNSLQAGSEVIFGLENISLHRVKSWLSFTRYHRFAPGVLGYLLKKDFDIVHVHGIRKPEAYLALFAAKLKRKRIVVSTHNPFTTVERSLMHKIFIFLHDALVGFWLMRFFDHYFLLSSSEIAHLKKFGISEGKMSVVGNAVSQEFFQDGIVNSEGSLTCLSVGRLHKNKGLANLELAVAQNPEVKFQIIGGDDGELSSLRKIFQGRNNVDLPGVFYSRTKLLDLYKNADIFLLPSLHEPFGIVLLEAMASSCAVIATNQGGPVDILAGGEYGLLLDPRDQQAWADSISSLKNDEKKLRNLQEKARQRAIDYTWEKILPIYSNVFTNTYE
ncbi:MAG: glycosyltransferase family 4 protein [Candidatus Dojkabacteria bacterium]